MYIDMAENVALESGSSLTIRKATPADAKRLIDLINSAFAIESFLEGTRTDAARLASSFEKGSILVMEDAAAEIVACVSIEVHGTRGYMGQLAVDPAHQGTGLARRMCEAAEQRLREQGCQVLDISVLSLRPELLPIYRRFGFVETGTEPFAFPRTFKSGEPCHCILMSKAL